MGQSQRHTMTVVTVVVAFAFAVLLGTITVRAARSIFSGPPPRSTTASVAPTWKWTNGANVTVCLATRTPHRRQWDGRVSLLVAGTLQGAGELPAPALDPAFPGEVVPCHNDEPDLRIERVHYIDIAEGSRDVWRIMYAASMADLPGFAARIGTRVSFRFDAHWGFAEAGGFVLGDDVGPVLAVEQGTFGPGLAREHVSPFSVGLGQPIGSRPDGCGDEVAHTLDVRGDGLTQVPPGRTVSLSVHGTQFRFWNAASHTWENPKCTDMLGSTSWALWRAP